MTELNLEQINNLAYLSRISLSEDEKDILRKDLKDILKYVEILNEVGTDNIKPTAQVTGLLNVQREDIVQKEDKREDLLDCSKFEKINSQIKVPKVL